MIQTGIESKAITESHSDQDLGHIECSEHDIHREQQRNGRSPKRTSPTFPALPPLQPEQVVVGLRTSSPVRSPARTMGDLATSPTRSALPESLVDIQQDDVPQTTVAAETMAGVQGHSSGDNFTTSHSNTASTTTPLTTTTATVRPSSPTSKPVASQQPSQPKPPPSQHPATSTPIDFLTLIASQERRVLELRDDLHRAETELEMLKKRWAVGEAKRKNAEIRRAAMRTRRASGGMNGGGQRASPVGAGIATAQEDRQKMMERRRSMMGKGTRATRAGSLGGGAHAGQVSAGVHENANKRPQQRLFSGGRHARTLSLLATPATKNMSEESSRHSQDQLRNGNEVQAAPVERWGSAGDAGSQTNGMRISNTESPIDVSTTNRPFNRALHSNIPNNNRRSTPPVPPGAEIWVRQGQKVAEGLKEGLWSLFEDIRQATVGEEGVSGPQIAPGEENRSATVRPSQERRPVTKDHIQEAATTPKQSFWSQFGVDTPGKNTAVEGRARANAVRPSKKVPLREMAAQPTSSVAHKLAATPARTPRASTQPRAAVVATVTDLLVDLDSAEAVPATVEDEEVDAEAEGEWEPWESPIVGGSGKGFDVPS